MVAFFQYFSGIDIYKWIIGDIGNILNAIAYTHLKVKYHAYYRYIVVVCHYKKR